MPTAAAGLRDDLHSESKLLMYKATIGYRGREIQGWFPYAGVGPRSQLEVRFGEHLQLL